MTGYSLFKKVTVPETLSEVHALTESELVDADEIVSLIHDDLSINGSSEKIYHFLSMAPTKLLVAICSRPEYLKITQLCRNDVFLQTCWKKKLQDGDYLDFSIPCVDGSDTLHLFPMLLGYYYYERYKLWRECSEQMDHAKNQANVFLMFALVNKIPNAGRQHIKASVKKLFLLCDAVEEGRAQHLDVADLVYSVKELLQIADQLGNHQWSPGYYAAGFHLREAAIKLANNPGERLMLSRIECEGYSRIPEYNYPLSLQLVAGAIRCYHSAWLLLKMDYSQHLWVYLASNGKPPPEDINYWDELRKSICYELTYTFGLLQPEIFVAREMDRARDKLQPFLFAKIDEEKQDGLSNRFSIRL